DTQRLFELVEQNRQLPKTSSPSPEVFRSVFEEAVAHGHQVLYWTLYRRCDTNSQLNGGVAAWHQ
ncbi:MAG: DegV family protein, partial [Firmicutes bacterium]|nr:DegV family protein [Bacillota bacterium]